MAKKTKEKEKEIVEPSIPKDITTALLDEKELSAIHSICDGEAGKKAALHLAASRLFTESNPEKSLEHSFYTLSICPNLTYALEMIGLAYYNTGNYKLAFSNLFKARLLSKSDDFDAMIADSLRGLNMHDKALKFIDSIKFEELNDEQYIELRIEKAAILKDLDRLEDANSILNHDIRIKGFRNNERIKITNAIKELIGERKNKANEKEESEKQDANEMHIDKNYHFLDDENIIIYDTNDEDEDEGQIIDEYIEPSM